MLKNFILFLFTFFLISCNNNNEEYVPDYGPKNIKFEPKYGKVGDIITITGDDFCSKEDMQLYLTDRQEFIQIHNDDPLVYFNVNIYYTDEGDWNKLNIEGTEVTEYIEFDTNKIVCKVPNGAKSGSIFVNGILNDGTLDLLHPSEEEFIVYDESGDIVR